MILVTALIGCLLTCSVAESSITGSNACLLHREDHLPCHYHVYDSTLKPGHDEYGIYSSAIFNRQECRIKKKNHQIKTIDTLGGDPRVKLIYSPGIELDPPEKYGNQMYVKYNISCPPGHDIAFYNVTYLDLEPKVCDNKCVDYIRVSRLGGGVTESCGTTVTQNSEQINDGNFEILFRSRDRHRKNGFRATVVCLASVDTAGAGRRKRNADSDDDFERSWKQRLESVESSDLNQLLVFRNFTVPFGGQLTFQNRILSVVVSSKHSDSIVKQKFVVHYLHVFDRNGRRYNRYTYHSRSPIHGPGQLIIIGNYAFFAQYLIKPKNILPANEEEREVINQLTTSIFDSFNLEDPVERLCDELLEPPPINFQDVLAGRVPSTYTDDGPTSRACAPPGNQNQAPCNFKDDDLLLVLGKSVTDSTNKVIKQLAESITTCTEREQPGRLQELQQNPTTTSPPLSLFFVNCRLAPSQYGGSRATVNCFSNIEAKHVSVSSCAVDRNIDYQHRRLFCSFPFFSFSLNSFSSGPHTLRVTFSYRNKMRTVSLGFTVPRRGGGGGGDLPYELPQPY